MQNTNQPLADRMRPKSLDQYFGQNQIIGENAILKTAIESGNIPSMIFWGPPGVGKTTLAKIIANQIERPFYSLSAINSGVKDVREAIEKAKKQQFFNKPNPILFIDEIHRFSKSQQDSLLGAVEQGIVTLIGATTENPSFEVISPLLSRCQVYILKPLEKGNLLKIINNAIKNDIYLKQKNIKIHENEAILRYSGGDARKLLNILELVVTNSNETEIIITNEQVKNIIQENIAIYDKKGEQHYDIISAFIKSIRGSDPNAAVYWLARMIEGGENIMFIARRLLILAAEDIGLANPNALLLANACYQSVHSIGLPEARIVLAETSIYLANSEKSNSAYMAINNGQELVNKTGDLPVPLEIRNAPTKLMKELAYGDNYKYAHNYKDHFAKMEFLPDEISNHVLYEPSENKRELEYRKKLRENWKKKYNY